MFSTVVPVMNGHPRDQAKVSVHCRWPLIRGNLTLKCVGRGIDNVAVQGRWPLTTWVAQVRYYCSDFFLGGFYLGPFFFRCRAVYNFFRGAIFRVCSFLRSIFAEDLYLGQDFTKIVNAKT